MDMANDLASEINSSTAEQLMLQATAFNGELLAIKADKKVDWYPYGSMGNVQHLCQILPVGVMEQLVAGGLDWRVLDVGAADGDLGYFFESRGSQVDFLDNPPTNYNDCKGIAELRTQLRSNARLVKQDIDRNITLDGQYDFALALGLLYHLRNPMAFLMTLAEHAERMVLSTRVASNLPDGTNIADSSIAYLLRCRESNNDPTNYWIFSRTGLETILRRSGWVVKTSYFFGAEQSNPVDPSADQRMFVYCDRVPNWHDLGKHHDF
ncbi:MAG: class I SAM-dependent methyltransferase [Candidatus Micrarchaeaceae archaeon]